MRLELQQLAVPRTPNNTRKMNDADIKSCFRKSKNNPHALTFQQLKEKARTKYKISWDAIHQYKRKHNIKNHSKASLCIIINGILQMRFNIRQPIADNAARLAQLNDQDKKWCQKKSKNNPDGLTVPQILVKAESKYNISKSMIYMTLREQDLKKTKENICKMIHQILSMFRNPARRPAQQARPAQPAPSPNNSIRNFLQSLPVTHPVFNDYPLPFRKVFAKMQLGMPLSFTDTIWRDRIQFRNMLEAAEQFDLNRNRPANSGLIDPGNNWKPTYGTNVNNILGTLNNNIFLSGNIPDPSNAVYITDDVRNKKIQTVYSLKHLKRWLMRKKESPGTRKVIESWNSIKIVPEIIMRRHGDSVVWGIIDAKALQAIHSTTYVARILKLILDGKTLKDFLADDQHNGIHVKNESNYKQLRTSCAVYVTMLKDYVDTKKTIIEKKNVLIRLNKEFPACVENVCSTISSFIQIDSNDFVFEIDMNADGLINISNCANALRNTYCVMLKRNEITKNGFKNKMKGIAARINSILSGIQFKDGIMRHQHIIDFLTEYGDGLLECPNFKAGSFAMKNPNFTYNNRLLGPNVHI